jgi:hypothetical protein
MRGMRNGIACAALSLIALIGVSCTPTQSFDITVQNKTDIPVLLWLTKDGPPAEKGWLTTEQFLAAPEGTPSPGVQLPPGKTADTGKVGGKFPKGTHAILLVYRTGAAAEGPGRSKPIAVQLRPGRNELAVGATNTGGLYLTELSTTLSLPPIIATEP